MKIDAFLTLESVLRTGTFAAAAQDMNLTPSAVSMQMKHLEQYLGQPLFDRSGLQVRPMPLAQEVSALMHGAIQGLEALRKRPQMAIEGVVRLGVIESMQPSVLPGAMRLLRERYPSLELHPCRGRSATLISSVKAGEIDAALVAQPLKGASSMLNWAPMLRRELVLIAPPMATETSVPALLRQYEWIRYDSKSVTGTLASQFVRNTVGDKRTTLEFDNAPAIIAMVSAGIGVSIVQIADPGLLNTYPVRIVRLGRQAPTLQFSLVSRKNDDSRQVAAVRDALAATFNALQTRRQAQSM